ncbi:MAG: hypothetical protein ACXABY_12520 [Candidatus Thorarchaeota archaeon]|jgi:hypothetical protein
MMDYKKVYNAMLAEIVLVAEDKADIDVALGDVIFTPTNDEYVDAYEIFQIVFRDIEKLKKS